MLGEDAADSQSRVPGTDDDGSDLFDDPPASER